MSATCLMIDNVYVVQYIVSSSNSVPVAVETVLKHYLTGSLDVALFQLNKEIFFLWVCTETRCLNILYVK